MQTYEDDIVAWADEQARLLRSRQFDQLDIAHIAEEIEDVGKSEQRDLASRITLLLARLLKWKYQPERRGRSWESTIRTHRRAIRLRLERAASLQAILRDGGWWEETWADAVAAATMETGLDILPEHCPWPASDLLQPDWLPD